MFFGQEISREERERMAMQAQADAMAVHSLLDSADEDTLWAAKLLLDPCLGEDGRINAAHMHGQVMNALRVRFGLCTCGGKHLAINHIKETLPPEDPDEE